MVNYRQQHWFGRRCHLSRERDHRTENVQSFGTGGSVVTWAWLQQTLGTDRESDAAHEVPTPSTTPANTGMGHVDPPTLNSR